MAAATLTAADCLLISRQPVCVNLDIYRGDDLRLQVTVTDEEGNPVDLTGATAQAQVRETPKSTKILGEFECTIVEPNIIQLHLPAVVTRILPTDSVWDLQITLNGDVITLVSGTIHVTDEVTR